MRLKFYLLLNFYQIIACIATVTMLSRAATVVNTAATTKLLKLPQQIIASMQVTPWEAL